MISFHDNALYKFIFKFNKARFFIILFLVSQKNQKIIDWY